MSANIKQAKKKYLFYLYGLVRETCVGAAPAYLLLHIKEGEKS